jgi:hypothetical protein
VTAPSAAPLPGQAARGGGWPPEARGLAESLQRQLAICERDWHALKGQRSRRAAEQVAAALVQLLAADDPAAPVPGEGRERAIALLDHALGWLRGEVSDPGCPHRRA